MRMPFGFRQMRIGSRVVDSALLAGNLSPLERGEAEATVTEIYEIILGRAPDDEGLAAFATALMSGTTTVVQIVREIVGSAEGRARLNPKSRSLNEADARDFLTSAYELVLRRPPDESGLAWYISQLVNDAMTPLDVLQQFLATEEFSLNATLHPKVTHALSAGNLSPLERGEAEATVTEIYNIILGRAPDDEGLAAFATALISGTTTIVQIVREIAGSDERHASLHLKSRSLNEAEARDFLTSAYELVLRRPPDESGLAWYISQLVSDAMTPLEVVQQFLTTEEFGLNAILHPKVARAFSRSTIATLMDREPDENTVEAYANSLASGRSISAFLQELIDSSEFRDRIGGSHANGQIATSLLQTAERLIISYLIAEGCSIAIPPPAAAPLTRGAPEKVRALLRTFDMLARSRH